MNETPAMNKRPTFSLRQRLLSRLAGPLLGVLIAGSLGSVWLAQHIASVVYDRWLYDSAMTLAQQIRHNEDGSTVLDLSPAIQQMFEWDSMDAIYEEVVSLQEGLIFRNAAFPAIPGSLAVGKPRYYNSLVDGQRTRIVAVRLALHSGDYIIQVAETKHKRKAIIIEILWYAVPLVILLLILAGASVWHAVGSGMRIIDRFSVDLDYYEAEKLHPLGKDRDVPAELLPLLNALDRLITRLADSQTAHRRFISNAAHQLRTPLATLQVQTERALREADPQRREEALSRVLAAVTRTHHLAHQLLTLARSEQPGGPALHRVPLDLAELARDELERWADTAIQQHIDLGYDGPESGVHVTGDPLLLRELIGNLVDNAMRYGRPGGVVTLGLRADPPSLYVDDDGPGIPPQERALVLERFYRPQGSRGDGCGLGLPIAREIAARHGASFRLLDIEQGHGLRVEVVFGAADGA